MSSTTRSPGRPESRYTSRSPVAGEMTNGGLVAIRSNRSPRTGSNREPSRTSTGAGTSLSAALKRARRSARGLTSVATTSALCRARCSAWTPQPVPRSSDRCTGSRSVSWARDVEAELMPSTWSAPTRLLLPSSPGREVADDPQVLVVGGVRAYVEPRGDLADGLLEEALGREAVDQAGQRALRGRELHRRLEQEQPDQRLERPAARRTPQAGRGLVAGEGVVGDRPEDLGHAVVGEAGHHQRGAQPLREFGERRGHALTVGPSGARWSRPPRDSLK